jgi:hypothetical protein
MIPKMNSFIKSSPLELILFGIFVIYLIFPIQSPEWIADMVDSSLGMTVIFCITVFLFFYAHPFLAILYVFVAFELIRRSAVLSGKTTYIQYTPSQEKKDSYMQAMNPPLEKSLEEDIITEMAPIGRGAGNKMYIDTEFKPVADNVHHATMI